MVCGPQDGEKLYSLNLPVLKIYLLHIRPVKLFVLY